MKRIPAISPWKYWLSYLTEVHIESAPSDINPHLYVSLRNGRLQLCSENAIYSYEDRYDNFRLLFDQIDLKNRSSGRVLILGLGLGSVPLLIELSGMNVTAMTFVEIDEEVIYLAEKYGLSRLSTPYDTYCTDARHFVTTNEGRYDLVISDIFLDDVIPEFFLSTEYLNALDRLLTKDGLLIMNTLASTSEDKKASRLYFESVFQPHYPQSELRHVWENYMLLNRRHSQEV